MRERGKSATGAGGDPTAGDGNTRHAGASRLRLARQLLVEGLTLSLVSACFGLTIAGFAVGLIRHVSAPGVAGQAAHAGIAEWLRLPLGKAGAVVQLDWWVFAFAGGLALITTLLFGLAPALGATGNALREDMKTAGLRVTAGREQRAVRHSLLVAEVDPAQPLFDVETMEERVADTVAQRRLVMLLTACFAGLAMLLSAVGVYGVFVYSVSQRRQEMGIRLALGASRGGVVWVVVLQAMRLIVVGGFAGTGAALLLSRLLASMVVGVSAHDTVSFSAACVLMVVIAIVASAIRATQAGRTDLASVLRSE
jgi:ABC-type antimicrobial peptide transport system permease subunit